MDEETTLLRQCRNCARTFGAAYRFCRWCGTDQLTVLPVPATSRDLGREPYLESAASKDSPSRAYISVSTLLVSSVVQGALSVGTERRDNRIAAKMIGVLIFLPLWIMIIMVSPFEAYFTSKSILR